MRNNYFCDGNLECIWIYMSIVLSMKKTLSEIDSKIENIIFQKPKFKNLFRK